MKKILSTLAISAILSTGATAGEIYGSIGGAITSVSYLDSGMSIVATAGMKMDQIIPGFAVEIEASQTVVDPSHSYLSSDWDWSIFGLGAYAVYNVKIPNSPITIKPRLGLNYQNWTYDNKVSTFGGAESSDVALSYGLNVSYPIGSNLNAYIDYTDKGSSDNIGLGVGMSF